MYEQKNYDHLIGIEGLSETALKNHFTLYGGYVKNVNSIIEILDKKEAGTIEYSELQRRLGWEWNGMRLHEIYFGHMKKGGSTLSDGKLKKKIEKTYGTFENWKKNFTAVASMRGIGWAILVHDDKSGELFNIWVNEHDVGHFAGATPLLVMDVFEHVYILDYGIKRIDYINAFMNIIDWKAVEDRLK